MLDSYEGNHEFYVKCGFEPVSWCKWNGEYAPDDWNKEFGKEDIIFYKYVGVGNVKREHTHVDDFKASVPQATDYMEAQKQQLKKVREKL